MTIPFPKTVESIAFCGDWHANAWFASSVIRKHGRGSIVIQLGDFGYQFLTTFLDVIQEAAEDSETLVLFVDGNHENFSKLYEYPIDADGVRRLRERVWHLPRGFRWEWDGVTFLALGGAHSVDRKAREPYLSWWPEEYLTRVDVERALEGGAADVMVTHDAPASFEIPGLSGDGGWIPVEDLRASQQHREIMEGVVNHVRPRFLWHGHYHQYLSGEIRHDDGSRCLITGLDLDRPRRQNVEVVRLQDLKDGVDAVLASRASHSSLDVIS